MRSGSLIVNLAPTGMVPMKEQTPHVPVSVDEIVEDVERCRGLGVSIVHVHARDEDGRPTHRREYFGPIVEAIRRVDPELVVCVTCSGRYVSEVEDRADVLSLEGDQKPDMASLTCGSNNFQASASVNSPQVIKALAERMGERGIVPELEVFEPGMLDFARYLSGRGFIPESCYVNVLLGNLGTSPATPGSLGGFLALMPESWTWAVAGLGRYQLGANMLGIASGGHVRVGLEDNIWWDHATGQSSRPTRCSSNASPASPKSAERPIATPREVREHSASPSPATATPTTT